MYFDSPTAPQYGHVGLYIGNNQVIHAFSTVKQMSVDSIIACGYAWQGWGVERRRQAHRSRRGRVQRRDRRRRRHYHGAHGDPHPQTEKVYTVYEQDSMGKLPDRYAIQWQSYATGRVRDISDRVTAPHADRRQRQRVHGVFLPGAAGHGEKYFPPLEIQPGDLVSCVNTQRWGVRVLRPGAKQVSGSYRESMTITCQDGGRPLTTNDIILQFDNVAPRRPLSRSRRRSGSRRFPARTW